MRARNPVVILTMLVFVWAQPSPGEPGCKDCSPFPVPRAEAEFRELLDVPRGFASGGEVSLEEIFLNLMPYGPLDLQVTGAATHDEISALKKDHENGSSYVLVEKLAKDVYFFETR